MSSNNTRTLRIAHLNDRLRTTLLGGKIVITSGIGALDDAQQAAVLSQVQCFDAFTADNDPHGEHDFGSIELPQVGRVFWKIDYYDLCLEYGSEDPADTGITRRVLTIMLASEY